MPGSDPASEKTARSRAELTQGERDELFSLVVQHARDCIRLHDLDGRIIYENHLGEPLNGRQPETWFELAHPDDRKRCQQWWEQVLAGGTERLRWRAYDGDQSWRWTETEAFPVEF